jgi:hypothetical protein
MNASSIERKATNLFVVLGSIVAILLFFLVVLFSISRIVLFSTMLLLLLLSSGLSLSKRRSHRRRRRRSEMIRANEEAVSVELDGAWEGTWAGRGRDRSVAIRGGILLLVIGILLELVIVGVVEDLELFLDGGPLPSANGTAARVLLLFLHLPQHVLLFQPDKLPSLVLGQTQPKLLDPLPFLCRVCTPDLRWRRRLSRLDGRFRG